jgi:protein phosphatase 2C family protein 2/3
LLGRVDFLYRNYNEDRVSIILNVAKPLYYTGEYWPKISIFAIYDGHGGHQCADYLRDHLHEFVIKDPAFPYYPLMAIKKGFENAETAFLTNCALDANENIINRSGSCALVVFIIGN